LLFVPVSGAYGMGEYARSLSIARAAAARWPVEVHFMLSRQAPYAAGTPFAHTLLPASPTFHSAEVIEFIEAWRPHAVLFDNAGRTAQLRAARSGGARVIYVSARPRQRRRAFRMGWMRLIDEHWIAYPEFIAGRLRPIERLKLRLLGRPAVRYLDVLIEPENAARRAALLATLGCAQGSYVLVVPGGGTGHPGAADATAVFRAAARRLAGASPVLFVGPVAPGDEPPTPDAVGQVTDDVGTESGRPSPRLRLLGPMPQPDLVELMRGARLVLANGGSTLMQAIACGTACVGAAIAKDQAQRLSACARAGAACAAPLEAEPLARTAAALLGDATRLDAVARAARRLGLADGRDLAMRALGRLLGLE
jgi:glycosyltransferase involved in cell wall biosynthesis